MKKEHELIENDLKQQIEGMQEKMRQSSEKRI
jgi:hypothetical protein